MSKGFKKEVLQQLQANDSDIGKPHKFEFYLYVPTETDAKNVAAKILKSGFSGAEVRRSATDDSWLCLASKTLVPEQSDLDDHARFFEEVAAVLHGQFDGWEAEIVER